MSGGATAVAPPGRLVQRVVRTGALARISVGSVVGPRGDGEEEGSWDPRDDDDDDDVPLDVYHMITAAACIYREKRSRWLGTNVINILLYRCNDAVRLYFPTRLVGWDAHTRPHITRDYYSDVRSIIIMIVIVFENNQ